MIDIDVAESIIAQELESLGWVPLKNESAIALKSFDTAVGVKTAYVYLIPSDGFNLAITADYQSEGRNILSNQSKLIPIESEKDDYLSIVKEFNIGVIETIENSYAKKLYNNGMRPN